MAQLAIHQTLTTLRQLHDHSLKYQVAIVSITLQYYLQLVKVNLLFLQTLTVSLLKPYSPAMLRLPLSYVWKRSAYLRLLSLPQRRA